jgi:filamentous hemagglutinin family protein
MFKISQILSYKYWASRLLGLSVLVWSVNCPNCVVLSQQIQPDKTLAEESSVVEPGGTINTFLITHGAVRGANLFHSFDQFSVGNGQNVYFNNPSGIERIIARVTGSSRSDILGKLGIRGNADLFLINPNGIILGPNASLDLKGSFLATTSSSLVFADTEYSAINTSSFPLLSINVPLGLRFRNVAGTITNQSKAVDPISRRQLGLQVKPGKTLALVGSDVLLDGGILTAFGGHIELGSVTGGQVDLTSQNLTLEYENIDPRDFGNISILNASTINTSSTFTGQEGGGTIHLQGKNIKIADGSRLFALSFSDKNPGGTIKVTASDSFELTGENPSKSRQSTLSTSSLARESGGGDIIINAKRIFLRDNALIQSASSFIEDNAGTLVFSNGKAGDVTITTTQMEVSGGASIVASTGGTGEGGNILINSSDYINIFGFSTDRGRSSGLFASSESSSGGLAGNITLKTRFLRVADGATVNVSSVGQGTAGNIDIFARSVLLENRGSINAETKGGEGNITFHKANDIILRNNSSITTNATDSANGGNITINTGVLLALSPTGDDGSDIVAKADKGRGGNIVINAQGIFGIEKRMESPENQTNDIDASSEFGRSGQVDINTAIDPNNGLTELPETVVDPDYQVAQSPCNRGWGNELTVSGRGGLPPSPSQDLSSEATQVKLVEPVQASNGTQNNPETQEKTSSLNSVPEAIIAPAQGWVYNKKGQVVLVAYDPTITGAQRLKVSPAGCPVP